MHDYAICVFYSAEDGKWVAIVPDLRCSALGETPEVALREVQIAKDAFLESLRDHGDPIPEPQYQPALYA